MNINNLQPSSITRASDQSVNKSETPTSSSISSIKEHELSKIAQDYESVNDRETSQSSLSSVKKLDLKIEGCSQYFSNSSVLTNNNVEKIDNLVKEKTQKEEQAKNLSQESFLNSSKPSLLINNNVVETDDHEVYLSSKIPLNPNLFYDEIKCTFADYLSTTLHLDKIQDKLKVHKEIFSTVFNTCFTSLYSVNLQTKQTTARGKLATTYYLLEKEGFSLRIESEKLKIDQEALVFKEESREPFINKPLTQFKKRPEEPSLTVLHIKKNGSNDLMEVTFTFRLSHHLKCEIPVLCSFDGKYHRFQTTRLSARLEVKVALDPKENALHEMRILAGNQIFIVPVFVMFYD